MRATNRSTLSGSSFAASIASASTEMAPMGVFSSWEMLATKSRRTASTRFCVDSSSAMTRTFSSTIGAMRAASSSRSAPGCSSRTTGPR